MEAVKLIVLRVAAMSSRQSEAAGRDQIGPHPMDGLVRAPPESSLLVVRVVWSACLHSMLCGV